MSKSKNQCTSDGLVPIKSKFEADIIRFSIWTPTLMNYEEFKYLLAGRHGFSADFNFLIWYTDPTDGDLLPINNDNNFERALLAARPLLRIFLQRKGERLEDIAVNGTHTLKPKNIISSILGGTPAKPKSLAISNPHDFRQVSAIIDVDILPETCRRVRLLKHGSDKPLGFYIKDGESFRVLPSSAGGGIEKVPGVFISRLVPGGLAESTGLLAVNDEVLEVNGIEVLGKTLDQVTDMMVANSSNLIITVKPANQRAAMMAPRRGSFSRNSQLSSGSHHSTQSVATASDEEDDEIVDLTAVTPKPQQSFKSFSSSQTEEATDSSSQDHHTQHQNNQIQFDKHVLHL